MTPLSNFYLYVNDTCFKFTRSAKASLIISYSSFMSSLSLLSVGSSTLVLRYSLSSCREAFGIYNRINVSMARFYFTNFTTSRESSILLVPYSSYLARLRAKKLSLQMWASITFVVNFSGRNFRLEKLDFSMWKSFSASEASKNFYEKTLKSDVMTRRMKS